MSEGAREVAFRVAMAGDAAALNAVHIAAWRETYAGFMPDDFLATLDVERRLAGWQRRLSEPPDQRDGLVLLCEVGGELAGFGTNTLHADSTEGEVPMLYLRRTAQGRGLGRALLGRLATDLADRGARSLILWMLEGNPAGGFYRHLGGIPGETRTGQFGTLTISEQAFRWPDISVLAPKGQ